MILKKRFSLFVLSLGLLLSNSAFCAQSEPVKPFYKRAATKISTFVKKHKWTIIKTACAITAITTIAVVGYLFVQNFILKNENQYWKNVYKLNTDAMNYYREKLYYKEKLDSLAL